jgi:hypothetical protein
MTVHIINPDEPKNDPSLEIKNICQEIDNVLHFLISKYDLDDRSVVEVTLARLKIMMGDTKSEEFNKILTEAREWKI